MRGNAKETFHTLQIIIAAGTLMAAMLTYVFGPEERIGLPHDVVLVCLAFLFGKFTNGYHRMEPSDWNALRERIDHNEMGRCSACPLVPAAIQAAGTSDETGRRVNASASD